VHARLAGVVARGWVLDFAPQALRVIVNEIGRLGQEREQQTKNACDGHHAAASTQPAAKRAHGGRYPSTRIEGPQSDRGIPRDHCPPPVAVVSSGLFIGRSAPLDRSRIIILLLVGSCAGPLAIAPAPAQSDRPLATEPAHTLPVGEAQAEVGVTWFEGRDLAGNEGSLWGLPALAGVVGIGPAADLRVEGSALVGFEPEGGQGADDVDAQREPGDFTFWTKVRLWRGTRLQPVVAGRLGVKLPVTSDESGLGTDEVDFHAQVLLSQTLDSARLNLNLGIAILGDPSRQASQNDALTYGLSGVFPLGGRVRILGEVAGRQGPGTFFDRSHARVGARWEQGGILWDAALSAGFIDESEDWGVLAGATFPLTWKPKEEPPKS
jgi:hypothetical protein